MRHTASSGALGIVISHYPNPAQSADLLHDIREVILDFGLEDTGSIPCLRITLSSLPHQSWILKLNKDRPPMEYQLYPIQN